MSKQRIAISVLILTLVVAAYWYFANTTNDESNSDIAQIANPASIYCVEELGGTSEFRDTPEGSVGICNLPDGRQCEEWQLFRTGNCETPWIKTEPIEPVTPSRDELVEQAGLDFMLDFVKLSPTNPDPEAAERIYERLSTKAKESVTLETLSQDILQFIDVERYPNQGASIEDLQIETDTQATLIVGLNYDESPRNLRVIELVLENSVWKVYRVYALKLEHDKGS